jgi:hypothetical protein
MLERSDIIGNPNRPKPDIVLAGSYFKIYILLYTNYTTSNLKFLDAIENLKSSVKGNNFVVSFKDSNNNVI